MKRKLHRPAKHGRFGRRAVARERSHQVDAILVPAASRAGREDEKHAPVALDEVAVSIPLLADEFQLSACPFASLPFADA